MENLSLSIQRASQRIGLQLSRYRPFPPEFGFLVRFLRYWNLDTVVDVGANTGQFARSLRLAGYKDRIISFEPLPGEHAILCDNAAEDANWIVPPAVALSDDEGIASFNVAGNSYSSSMLPMDARHVAAAPYSRIVAEIQVPTRRLDNVIHELHPCGDVFLKLDVQGFEANVLAGATGIMPRVIGIKTEMSFAELYKGQVLFEELHRSITEMGFELWDLTPGFRDEASGRLLQCDGVYFRQSSE